MDQECNSVWSVVVKALPEEQMKFFLNTALDMLPHNHNIHLWKKKPSPACTLCGENQTLLQFLNNWCSAMNLRHYNDRHDLVLQEIASAIKPYLPPTTSMSVDISEGYKFSLSHCAQGDLRERERGREGCAVVIVVYMFSINTPLWFEVGNILKIGAKSKAL